MSSGTKKEGFFDRAHICFSNEGTQITLYLGTPTPNQGTKEGVRDFGPWDPLGRSGPPPKRFFAIFSALHAIVMMLPSYLQRIEIMKKHDFEAFSHTSKKQCFQALSLLHNFAYTQRQRNFESPLGTRQNAVLDPPRHSTTFYGTPRNRRIDGTLPADFFSAPDPCFLIFAHIVSVSTCTRNIVNVTCHVHETFSPHLPHRKR